MIDDRIEEAISRLRRCPDLFFGGEPVLGVERAAIRVRPFSFLVPLRVTFRGSSRNLILKVPRVPARCRTEKLEKLRTKLKTEYEAAKSIGDLFVRSYGIAGAVKPVALFPDLLVLATEESPGTTLYELVTRGARWYPSAPTVSDLERRCSLAGRWLRCFQTLTRRPQEHLPLESLWSYLEPRLDKLAALRRSRAGARWKADFERYFERTAGRVSDDERVITGIHGDFSLSNVLSDDADIVVLDFSGFRFGSPLYDLTRFYHQLKLLLNKPCFRRKTVEKLQAAFLEGYGAYRDGRSPLFDLHLIQHHVCHWLGRVKEGNAGVRTGLFNRWVCLRHERELRALISDAM